MEMSDLTKINIALISTYASLSKEQADTFKEVAVHLTSGISPEWVKESKHIFDLGDKLRDNMAELLEKNSKLDRQSDKDI